MVWMFDVYELQKQLVAAANPSGYEQGIGKLLAGLAAPFVDEIRIDPLLNVICHKEGCGKKIMMAAHLDAIGFMATYIDARGCVWFAPVGGHSPAMLANTRIRFLNGTRGIIRMCRNVAKLGRSASDIGIGDLYIDIGASNQAEAQSLVKIGDVAVFEGTPQKVAGGNVVGPYADDLIACVVLLLVMEQVRESPNDLYYVFTSQEERGCVGSTTVSYAINPDFGIASDVTYTGDTPADKKAHMALRLGMGPTIKIMDGRTVCAPDANDYLRGVAAKNGIAYQDEILPLGGTDTCRIQTTRSGVPATCVSIPTRNIHTAVEMFNIGDVENAAKLIAAAITEQI